MSLNSQPKTGPKGLIETHRFLFVCVKSNDLISFKMMLYLNTLSDMTVTLSFEVKGKRICSYSFIEKLLSLCALNYNEYSLSLGVSFPTHKLIFLFYLPTPIYINMLLMSKVPFCVKKTFILCSQCRFGNPWQGNTPIVPEHISHSVEM